MNFLSLHRNQRDCQPKLKKKCLLSPLFGSPKECYNSNGIPFSIQNGRIHPAKSIGMADFSVLSKCLAGLFFWNIKFWSGKEQYSMDAVLLGECTATNK